MGREVPLASSPFVGDDPGFNSPLLWPSKGRSYGSFLRKQESRFTPLPWGEGWLSRRLSQVRGAGRTGLRAPMGAPDLALSNLPLSLPEARSSFPAKASREKSAFIRLKCYEP
jgi:hypothetical protein